MSVPDTTDQSVIVCPHCGHRNDDSLWFGHGFQNEQGAENCEECDKEFFWSRTTIITYTTTKNTTK